MMARKAPYKPRRYIKCEGCGVKVEIHNGNQKYCPECAADNASRQGMYSASVCWSCEFLQNCRRWVWEYDKALPCMPRHPLYTYWQGLKMSFTGNMSAETELRMIEYVGVVE